MYVLGDVDCFVDKRYGEELFFEVLSEPFQDEEYLPDEERRPQSKTVPKNGGRNPDTFDVWEAFEEEVA